MSLHRRSGALVRVPLAVVVVLSLLLALAGCGSKGGGDAKPAIPTSTTPPAPAGTTSSPSPSPTAAGISDADLTTQLAGVGIEVYANAGDARPVVSADDPGPLRLTGWQLHNMRQQLVNGRGYRGRDLDALTSKASPTVPIAVVLAAWLTAAHTPASDYASTLMGTQDYAGHALDIAYPDAVVALFVDDIASRPAGSSPSATGTGATQPAAYVAQRAGLCSSLIEILTGTLDSIVSNLQAEVDEGDTSILATIWNTVVSIAASAAKLVIQAFTATFLAPITKAITLLAVLSSAATLLDPWNVINGVDPSDSIGPGTEATVTEQVLSTVGFQWPADVTACAQGLTGIESLPDPGSPAGSPVSWTFENPDGNAVPGEEDQKVDGNGQAALHFATSPEADQDGTPVQHYVDVGIDVRRTQVPKLIDLISDLFIAGLPTIVRTFVDLLLGPTISDVRDELASLVSIKGPVAYVDTFTFEKDPAQPPAPPQPQPQPCSADTQLTTIPAGTWTGPVTLQITGTSAGLEGAIDTETVDGSDLTLVSTAGSLPGAPPTTVQGTIEVRWTSTGDVRTEDLSASVHLRGVFHGSVSGSVMPLVRGGFGLSGDIVFSGGVGDVPVDVNGGDAERMKLVHIGCDRVEGDFVLSFNSHAPGHNHFEGVATWEGHRVS